MSSVSRKRTLQFLGCSVFLTAIWVLSRFSRDVRSTTSCNCLSVELKHSDLPSNKVTDERISTPQNYSLPEIFSESSLSSPRAIPPLILRTWKTNDKNHLAADKRWTEWFATWTKFNPGHAHILFDDDEAAEFVKSRFPGKIAEAYFRLPLIVQRTDFLRYLMVWYFGGVYSDMDTGCLKPIDDWAPKDTKLIAGLEFTLGFEGRDFVQLTQWTIAATPRHPIYSTLIAELTEKILAAEDFVLHSLDHVVGLTGPVPYTKAVINYIESFSPGATEEISHLINGYRTFGDVTILGVSGFAPGNPLAYGYDHPDACIRHEYTGEWGDGWKKTKNYAKDKQPASS